MTCFITKTAAVALVATVAMGAGLMATTTPADASEHCKGVHITVDNPAGSTIKVVDIDYWDESSQRWRSKAIKNRTIRPGQSWSWTKRLNGVAAESTAVRIEYKVYIGKTFNKWSKVQSTVQGMRTCRNHMAWHFSI